MQITNIKPNVAGNGINSAKDPLQAVHQELGDVLNQHAQVCNLPTQNLAKCQDLLGYIRVLTQQANTPAQRIALQSIFQQYADKLGQQLSTQGTGHSESRQVLAELKAACITLEQKTPAGQRTMEGLLQHGVAPSDSEVQELKALPDQELMAVLARTGQSALYHAENAQMINLYANLLRNLGDRLSDAQRLELATPRGSDGGLAITHMLKLGRAEEITAYRNLLNLLDEKARTCALTPDYKSLSTRDFQDMLTNPAAIQAWGKALGAKQVDQTSNELHQLANKYERIDKTWKNNAVLSKLSPQHGASKEIHALRQNLGKLEFDRGIVYKTVDPFAPPPTRSAVLNLTPQQQQALKNHPSRHAFPAFILLKAQEDQLPLSQRRTDQQLFDFFMKLHDPKISDPFEELDDLAATLEDDSGVSDAQQMGIKNRKLYQ